MRNYEAYKDSRIDWIGEIPEHWECIKLKFVSSVFTGSTPDSGNRNYWDGETVWVTPTDISSGDTLLMNSLRKITEAGIKNSGVSLLPKDAIVLTTRAPIGNIAIAGVQLTTNQGCKSLVVNDETYHRFVYYQLLAARKELESLGSGTTFKELSTENLKSFTLALPPYLEQVRLSKQLDKALNKLNHTVDKKRQLIQLLQEEKAALINHAVTKGLDDKAAMKSSGIGLLGDIPAHWEVKKLKRLTSLITNGYVGPTRDILRPTGVRYIQSLHIKGGTIKFHTPYHVSHEWSTEHSRSILHEKDILIVQTGAVGSVGIVPTEFVGCNCHALIIVRVDEQNASAQYIFNILQSNYGFHVLKSIETGALHPHLNSTTVCDIVLPVPPMKEQTAISSYINKHSARIDNAIAKIEREVVLLSEYKTSLIYEVVTGKVKVDTLVEEPMEVA